MSKRRRGARDSRPPKDDDRLFAAPGGGADSGAAPFGGVAREVELSAGQMLRALREGAGIDAALVASALKVTPQKIDALEGERYDELPDVTFARGLAAAFCRAFGEDPAPVLARMPAATLSLHATGHANEPLQGGSGVGFEAPTVLPRPLLWIVAALLLAALVIWLLPPRPDTATTEVEPLSAPAPAVIAPEHTVQLPPALPASQPASAGEAASAAASASAPASAAAAGALFDIEAREAVWVEVVDATERKRISRTLARGERASVTDAPLPLSVAIGRRDAASVSVRGEPFDLAQAGGSGVARFQVK